MLLPDHIRCARRQHKSNRHSFAYRCSALHSISRHNTLLYATKMLLTSIIDRVMPPLHLFAYSTLLGTEMYQSFVMTKLAYQSLPQSAFRSLQKSVFPVYFQGQTLLLALVVCTLPPHGPQSLVGSRTYMVTFAVAGGTALLNLLIFGPKTQRLMIERVHQGKHHRSSFVVPYRLTARSDSAL
jgi:hypothetical protein